MKIILLLLLSIGVIANSFSKTKSIKEDKFESDDVLTYVTYLKCGKVYYQECNNDSDFKPYIAVQPFLDYEVETVIIYLKSVNRFISMEKRNKN